jgi:VWFA-related protein
MGRAWIRWRCWNCCRRGENVLGRLERRTDVTSVHETLQWPRMRFAGLVALSLVVLASGPGAASRGGAQSPTPTLDLIVTHPDGRPVADLRPEDLIVRLDSRPQTVTGVHVAVPAPATVRAGLPLPYGTNAGGAGRATAVIVDVTRLTPTRTTAIRTGLQSLATALSPADRLALIPLSTDLRPVDFTTSHTRVVEAADALTLHTGSPRTDRQDETAVEATLLALGRAATLLGAEPGVKPLVLVTEPFTITTRLRRAIQTLAESVTRHRIALYVVTPGTSEVPASDGVYALAVGTGGAVVASGSWSSIVAQERARVEVTLAPDAELDADTTVRALIASARTGLVVRAAPFALVPVADPDAMLPLADMLRQSRTFSDLPLRIAAYPILHSDRSSIRLLIVGETIDDGRPLAWGEFALISPDGRMVARWSENREAVAQRPLISGALAPEGVYRLRWAASELSGRRGTVDVDVDARFTPAGPFRLSALMLGRMNGDTFQPVLQFPAGASTIEWYAEVYGDLAASRTVTARLDVLTSTDGPVLRTEPGRVLTSPDPSRRAITGVLDLASVDLDAGDYLLRATLVVNGADAGSITRTFRRER